MKHYYFILKLLTASYRRQRPVNGRDYRSLKVTSLAFFIPLLFLFLCLLPKAQAQAPANDLCVNAQSITGAMAGTNICGTTINAGADNPNGGADCPNSNSDAEGEGVWYTFTGDGTTWTFNFPQIGEDWDPEVNVYSGSCGSLTCVGGDDDSGGGLTAEFSIATVSGTIYFIYVHPATSVGGTHDFCFSFSKPCTEPPAITCPGNITVNNTTGMCGAVVTFTAPVGTSACPGATTTQTAGLASGATFPIGMTTNTFVVTAANGQTATCSFTVTVTDNEPPTITCPANISVSNQPNQCGSVVTYTAPVGTDNCPGATTSGSPASGSFFPVGTTTVTYTVTAGNGQTASCSFTVTVNDTQPPTLTCPANISVNTDAGQCGAAVTYAVPTGSDNCPGFSVIQTAGLASGSTFPTGVTTNTFRVTAANLQTTDCSFTVTVTDNEAPVITCPANLTVNNQPNQCGAVVTFLAVVGTDNCSGATTTVSIPSGSFFPVGITPVTYTVTASNNQTATCVFTVTVVDNQPPTLSCPSNISVSNDANQCSAVVTFATPTGSDNCPGFSVTQTTGLPSGSAFPIGTTTNTFRVTDTKGLTADCSFTVTVNDTQPPIITCPANLTACEGSVVSFTAPVGSDNCPGATTIQTTGLPSGSVYPVGVTTNTFQVTSNGQTATCSFTVTVYPRPTATISGTASVCQNAPATITFIANGGTDPYTFTYQVNGGSSQTVTAVSGNTATVNPSTANAGILTYTLLGVSDAHCSQNQSGTATLTIQAKPTITLNVLGQTLQEGNNPVLCDTDANPTNPLLFNVNTGCVSGAVQWRTQIGAGAWSAWSAAVPNSQLSVNTAYRYQAACDVNCPSTFTNPIELTINFRASTPQNVSLVADGTTVAPGETKTLCDSPGNTLTFSASCAAGEIVLYSVDGGNYSSTIPSQIVDGNFHNYRVRCRKTDNTPSCVETESAAMSLKITTSGPAPTVSISPLSNCGTPTAFTGTSTCGVLATIWFDASTNGALSSLPAMTPTATTSYYARCRNEAGCLSEKSNTVTFTLTPVNDPPTITTSTDIVCIGTQVTISANCPAGSTAFWNTGVSTNSFQVAFTNVTTQTYWAKCIFAHGCQTPESAHKSVFWKAFELTLINIGQSQSGIKAANDRNLWASQFITKDAGPVLENSTQANPTIYYTERPNKGAPRFWTIQVETCNLGTDGSVTYDMLAAPEVGVPQSFNTHENNSPYLMYANREGWTELYAQNHPAYGFYQSNGSGGNTYDTGLPKGLYKLGIRYWDQKGQGSIYPSTRQPAGNVLAYQEYWFRIQSQNGIGMGAGRIGAESIQGSFAQVAPNPVSQVLRLKIGEAKGQKVSTGLMDASGRTLLQRSFVPQTDQHHEEFEVSQLANGMYFLQVKTADKQTTLKVIKVQ